MSNQNERKNADSFLFDVEKLKKLYANLPEFLKEKSGSKSLADWARKGMQDLRATGDNAGPVSLIYMPWHRSVKTKFRVPRKEKKRVKKLRAKMIDSYVQELTEYRPGPDPFVGIDIHSDRVMAYGYTLLAQERLHIIPGRPNIGKTVYPLPFPSMVKDMLKYAEDLEYTKIEPKDLDKPMPPDAIEQPYR